MTNKIYQAHLKIIQDNLSGNVNTESMSVLNLVTSEVKAAFASEQITLEEMEKFAEWMGGQVYEWHSEHNIWVKHGKRYSTKDLISIYIKTL